MNVLIVCSSCLFGLELLLSYTYTLLSYTLSRKIIDAILKKLYEGSMSVMVNIKIDPRMKKALQNLADRQFVSMSALIKQAIEKHLQDHGIDWRKESPEK
jgi:hypothetical protein